jgi:hypothetical protein
VKLAADAMESAEGNDMSRMLGRGGLKVSEIGFGPLAPAEMAEITRLLGALPAVPA